MAFRGDRDERESEDDRERPRERQEHRDLKDVAHEFKIKIECQARSKQEQTALDKRSPHSSSRTVKEQVYPERRTRYLSVPCPLCSTRFDTQPSKKQIHIDSSISYFQSYRRSPSLKLNAFEVQCRFHKNTSVLSFDMRPRPQRVPHPSKLQHSKPRALHAPSWPPESLRG